MRPFRRTLAATLVAALAAASAASARSDFNGNVCRLVSARQATAVSGVSSKCTNAKPSRGIGSTLYVADWTGKTTSVHLEVTVSLYTDTGALQLAKRNLKQGLPGAPKKVAGIGSAAFEATGAAATAIHLTVGKYVVYVTLTRIGKPPGPKAPLEALGRAIAARL